MDEIGSVMGRLSQLSKNIEPLEMLARDELAAMDDHTLWTSVCHSIIADTLEEVKEGTHLFQCAWSNREIFSERNNPHHYMIAKDPGVPKRRDEPKPEIQVNIAQLARFAMVCPYEGTERCPRRNFAFAASEEEMRKDKRKEKQLAWAEDTRDGGYRPDIKDAVFTGEDSIAK